MDHRNGRAHRTPKALPEQISHGPRMGPCNVPLVIRCQLRSVGLSATARCGCSMPRALAIAAHARLGERCQESGTTLKPRRESRVLWPIFSSSPGSAEAAPVRQEALAPPPGSLILWGDWERCQIRRSFLALLRTQTVTVTRACSRGSEGGENRGQDPCRVDQGTAGAIFGSAGHSDWHAMPVVLLLLL